MSNNFNDARKKAIEAYKSLVAALNDAHPTLPVDSYVEIPPEDIEEYLDDLCAALMVIGSAYVSGNEGFSRIIPEGETLPLFNPNR